MRSIAVFNPLVDAFKPDWTIKLDRLVLIFMLTPRLKALIN